MDAVEAVDEQLESLARRYAHRVPFFVDKVRRSFVLGPVWNDDLASAGYWGLFKALRNRRPDAHERELSAYVSTRIHGAVMDAARSCLTQLQGRDSRRSMARDDLDPAGSRFEDAYCHRIEDSAAGPEELASKAWKRSAIRSALARLDASDHRLVCAYMEGESLSEIAREQGVAAGTLQLRFHRIMRRLRAGSPELRRILLDREIA